mmetsp:Transcript_13481/g.35096  ORF Transcript_13481/g.35096 Transcript_13481/m.35096 type:complete len:258 (+) Transcript_13481:28-801(+)
MTALPVRSAEEFEALKAEYDAEEGVPASTRYADVDKPVEVISGRAWLIPNVLSPTECEDLIAAAEAHSLQEPAKEIVRTAHRTKDWRNEELGPRVMERLPAYILQALESSGVGTQVCGLHPNWRIVRYEAGQVFRAHQDQSSYLKARTADGANDTLTSSHTLLIGLSAPGTYEGGATRFWPHFFENRSYAAQEAVDVHVPMGACLVFEQKGLLHSGQPVEGGVKYVAQAGLLRSRPEGSGKLPTPSIFRTGPGLFAG